MQDYFYDLSDFMKAQLRGDEVLTSSFSAEDSEFVRFNHNAVRQAGAVKQRYLSVRLIDGSRHGSAGVTLSGDAESDKQRAKTALAGLRGMLPHVPEDPHLLYSREVKSSERHGDNRLPSGRDAIGAILERGQGKDLVGIYSAGGIYSGFANSLGQRNWYSTHSFNVDWSLYHQQDKAVKLGYAGFEWQDQELAGKMESGERQLAVLSRTPRTIDPGRYRVYLSPVAMFDIMGTVSWGGFGLKDHRTKHTCLLKMVEGGAQLNPKLTVSENTAEGVAPDFQDAGFIKPGSVELIGGGCFRNCLASPRSAKEYGVPTNAASSWEMPESIDVAGGSLPRDAVLQELDTGLYINNVWYLNFSDRSNCRITGMTRFATFWVENGQVQAPVNVMRFDETIYRVLGDNLRDLTTERDFILDAQTYDARSTLSGRLPGALVEDFTFTL